jgi:hypothetical protein
MSDHRWQGYTHPELFEQINDGPGAEASTSSVRRWTELTRALGDIDSGIASALSSAMGAWEGEAADNARGGLRPLGEWAVEAQQAAEMMRDRAQQQAEFIGKARADMPPPMRVTAEDPGEAGSLLVHLFGGQTDYEAQEAEQDAAEQRAFQVMRTYEQSTTSNTTSLASFTPPPQVVVDVPAMPAGSSSGIHQPPVTISWGAVAGAAGGAALGGRAAGAAPGSRATRGSANGRGDRTTSTGRGGAEGSRGTGAARHSSGKTQQEAEPVDRSVTEQYGRDGGFFDEPRTLSRPVIGGDPS